MNVYSNPSNSADKYLSQISGTVTPYYSPYINAGDKSLDALNNQFSSLLGSGSSLQASLAQMLMNPAGVMSQVGSNYQQSPGYQWQMQQGLAGANNAQAAGGMLGTPQNEQFDDEMSQGIANQDFDQYMKTALGIGKEGLQGTSQLYQQGLRGTEDMSRLGYQASNSLAEALAQTLMAQANNAYAGAANQNQHNEGLLGGVAGLTYGLTHPSK